MSDVFVGDNDHGDTPLPPLSDLLWAEVTKLRQDKVRLEEDIVHFAKELNEVTHQRDEARRQVCKDAGILRSVYVDPDQDINEWANYIAKVNKWDCFNSVTESYEKIANKYHTTFQKLAQEENTNEN